jgi:hypothetical protein
VHGGQIEAPVEAVLDLGEVAKDVALGDRLERTGHGCLEIAEDRVDPTERRDPLGVLGRPLRDDRLMATAPPVSRIESNPSHP